MPDLDLLGEQEIQAPKASKAGRPRLPLRLMISLLDRKHAFNESEEALMARWTETPSWQYFSGRAYFENALPCDASTLANFRKLLGEEGGEELLAQTIKLAMQLELSQAQDLTQVIVDNTVQEQAITYSTDSRLLERARQATGRCGQKGRHVLEAKLCQRRSKALPQGCALRACKAIQTHVTSR